MQRQWWMRHSGLVGLTVMMGATYAMRDRIKEAFHRWLAGHVYRLYAQRVVRCFMPDHLVTPRQTIVHEPSQDRMYLKKPLGRCTRTIAAAAGNK